jgi:tetratricopeptide (TPR) repeat protein
MSQSAGCLRIALASGFCLASLYLAQAVTESTMLEATSVGIVISRHCPVFADASTASAVVDSGSLGDVFFILGSENTMRHFIRWDRPEWHQVVLACGRRGWVADSTLKPMRVELIDGRVTDAHCVLHDSLPGGSVVATRGAELRLVLHGAKLVADADHIHWYYNATYPRSVNSWYGSQSLEWGSEWNLDVAEALFLQLLDRYPTRVFLNRAGGMDGTVHGGVVALQSLAKIQVDRGEYDLAIQRHEEIIDRFPDVRAGMGLAAGVAKWDIARILAEKKHDPYRAIEVYLEIIRDYPQEEISGYEWNSTLDYSALDAMRRLAADEHLPDDYILAQYMQAIEKADFDVVKVVAHTERAKILQSEGQFKQAGRELVLAYVRYPSAAMTFFKDYVHFSVDALDLHCQYACEGPHGPAAARSTCRSVIAQNLDTNLVWAARFFQAEILDRYDGGREDVIEAYEDIANDPRRFGIGVPNRGWNANIGMWQVKERLDAIRSFKPVAATTRPDALLLLAADSSARPIIPIQARRPVTVLYPKDAKEPHWLKVRAQDGTVGWLMRDNLDL